MTIWHRLHGFYRNTSEPSRMENRRRGGGNQCRKHRSTPRIRYPSTTAGAIRPARKRPATDQHAADGPAHDSAGGAGAPDAKELLVVAILHSCAVSREGAISSRFMRLADRCFGPCGTAARRLPGTPVGDTPICVSFRGWGRNRKKWTERPGTSPTVTSLDFEYLEIPSSSTWQRT
jgi:hypothetical protein